MIKPHQNHGNPWVSVLFLPLLCGWFGLRQLAKNNIPRATTRDCPYKQSIDLWGKSFMVAPDWYIVLCELPKLAGPFPFAYIQNHWEISLTMVFGSLIAGATSEGGGAVAFPVFTKLLHISPQEATVFSLAIQSVGMTAASIVFV